MSWPVATASQQPSDDLILVDTHCHLNFKDYPPETIAGLIARAQAQGVKFFITIGAGEGVAGNQQALNLAHQYSGVFATVGIHPHDAKMVNDDVLSALSVFAQDEGVRAIGEVGLDFYYEHSERAVQERILPHFIDLARKLHKPLVIHDRGAGVHTYEIFKSHQADAIGAVVHCFTGSYELAKKYLDLGFLLSFTGIVTFKNAVDVQEVVRQVPIESIMVETDSPFLAPLPYRGKTNEPAHVRLVAEKIAELKGLRLADVARITTLNAQRFFRLPLAAPRPQIVYQIRDSLYLNITNRCTLACKFCPKFAEGQLAYAVKGHYLKLAREPSATEVLDEVKKYSHFKEVVFCGYGESTRRLDVLKAVAHALKKQGLKVRLNTDGLGNLVHGRDIIPELAGLIDSVSISLNAADAATYARWCPSKFGEAAYAGVKDFIRSARGKISEVVATVVELPGLDVAACQRVVAEDLKVVFRLRPYDEVG